MSRLRYLCTILSWFLKYQIEIGKKIWLIDIPNTKQKWWQIKQFKLIPSLVLSGSQIPDYEVDPRSRRWSQIWDRYYRVRKYFLTQFSKVRVGVWSSWVRSSSWVESKVWLRLRGEGKLDDVTVVTAVWEARKHPVHLLWQLCSLNFAWESKLRQAERNWNPSLVFHASQRISKSN